MRDLVHPFLPRLAAGVAAALLVTPMVATRAAAQVEVATEGALVWREIGPAVMGGRISDLAVVESNRAVFYVGTASGGLWKTTNHGTSWQPLFDAQPTASIGDVTLAPSNPNIVWVGTGEPQNRQSSPWGNGVYRSTDGGRTWEHVGLEETRHIGRIVVHPGNPDIVYVAAVGHLWGANPERGVFKTIDGGRTWSKVLFLDEDTGAIDLVMDPGDPQTLFAAMYQRRRTAFGFNGGGPGSAIYRTTDGGASWRELTEGLPTTDMGRIGLDVFRRDGNVVYAVVEAPRERGRGVYRSLDRGETWEFRSETNPRPMYFSLIRIDPNDPDRVYLGGQQLHVSDDGGKTFRDDGAEGVHLDHHALWIDPHDSRHLILGSDGGVSVSFDRARSWRMYDNLPIAQFYQIGVDMRDPYWVCGGLQDNGSWCGPSATRSRLGIRNGDWFNIYGGDGFYTQIDPNDHTIVFAESQNGNIGRVDVTTGEIVSIRPFPKTEPDTTGAEQARSQRPRYRWNWNTPIVMSAHDPATIYVGGNVLLKSEDRGYTWTEISPDLTKQIDRNDLPIMGVKPTAGMLSRHDGVSTYGNITTISESVINPQLLYAGTDDGNLQVTRDGGATWTDLTPRLRGVPERTYVSRVVASRHDEGTVYATFDGHYHDDYRSYVYVSHDLGESWRRITDGLPDWSVNVIAEHPRTANLLFVGNEIGVYYSTDGGGRWARLGGGIPTVPVDDIVIHPRDNDLVVGTHGRGVWILPDVAPLQELSPDVLASPVHLFGVRPASTINVRSPQGWSPGTYAAPDPPTGALIRYYLREGLAAAAAVAGTNGPRADGQEEETPRVSITILDGAGGTVGELEGPGKAGMEQVVWNLRLPPPFEPEEEERQSFGFFGTPRGPKVLPGTYTVRLEAAGQTQTRELVVRGDPRISIARNDLEARQDLLMDVYALAKPMYEAGRAIGRLNEQLSDARRLLQDREAVPDAITDEARALRRDVGDVGRRLNRARSDAFRVFFGLDRATVRPTADQRRLVDESWEAVEALIPELNVLIADRLPAFYRMLDEQGIRPDPGPTVAPPRRPGG